MIDQGVRRFEHRANVIDTEHGPQIEFSDKYDQKVVADAIRLFLSQVELDPEHEDYIYEKLDSAVVEDADLGKDKVRSIDADAGPMVVASLINYARHYQTHSTEAGFATHLMASVIQANPEPFFGRQSQQS